MTDMSKIVEDLPKLTVLEAAELSKLLEAKWGASAAAPVAMAMPAETMKRLASTARMNSSESRIRTRIDQIQPSMGAATAAARSMPEEMATRSAVMITSASSSASPTPSWACCRWA